ncbi:beta/alpha barrel domain-containing protein [Enterococcus rivorum]|uniref:Deoxyribose-phosphate aldolase n=1 Tax=Enterococcus rivorum TaxID=762845 RepID=A0A1E5KZG1_9ENTE|nr:deoxyribose-phosphate aldolase [Enterococcus rivorum]MBP2099410.1 deoxyribose-phosphate aldolase [Enterococcus rivorum]OEH83204.1 deoxyribose-phosphate aldolase [Enterococcus rivorum]
MELELEKFSVMLLDPTLTDQMLKEELLFIKQFPIRAVFVLPYQVKRAKQLLADSQIQIGSFVDYPFGMGTVAKKAFETGQLYRDGATIVQTTFEPENMFIEKHVKQTYEALEPISFGVGRLGLVFNTREMLEAEKERLFKQMIRFSVKNVSLGMDLPIEAAIYDLGMFRSSGGGRAIIQINVKAPTLLDLELLFQAGADYIGISNPREVLPLIAKWT